MLSYTQEDPWNARGNTKKSAVPQSHPVDNVGNGKAILKHTKDRRLQAQSVTQNTVRRKGAVLRKENGNESEHSSAARQKRSRPKKAIEFNLWCYLQPHGNLETLRVVHS